MKLPRSFFARSVHEVAPELVGATLLVDGVGGKIVEVEAYDHEDPAAHSYRGQYHVLHGRLAPLENMGPEQLNVDALPRRVQQAGVQEVIMATNPTLEGDGTALYISNLLAGTGVRITRLARGLPSGSALEFANNQMLADALEGRRSF